MPRCQFGLKGPQGKFLKKPTKIVSNNERILAATALVCTRDHVHETIQGSLTRMSENYPWALAVAVADVIMGTTTAKADIPTAADDVLEVCGNITYRLDQAGTNQTGRQQLTTALNTQRPSAN